MDLLPSSVAPQRLDLSTADHQRSKLAAALAPCAGAVSAAGRNKSLNEAGRFHFWAEAEHARERRSATRRSYPGDAEDLFGRGRPSTTPEPSAPRGRPEKMVSPSGRSHCIADLAGGISEAETVASARDLAESRSPRPEAARGELQPCETSRESRDAMHFADYRKPARARCSEPSPAAGYAGLNCQDYQNRRAGDSHGRRSTNGYHERYAENVHGSSLPGSSLPGSAGVAAEGCAIHTPRRALNSATCDPSKQRLTASSQAKASCRFHASADDATFKRRQSQNDRARFSNASSEATKAAEPTSRSSRSSDYRSPRTMEVGTGAHGPTLGRMDRRPRTPREAPERPVVATMASPEPQPSMQLSAGGVVMTSKRRVQDAVVGAARPTSSPIAPEGAAWTTTASGLDSPPRGESSAPSGLGGEAMPSKRRVSDALVPAARMSSAPISWSDSQTFKVFVPPSSGTASPGMPSRGRVSPARVAAARQTSAPFATE